MKMMKIWRMSFLMILMLSTFSTAALAQSSGGQPLNPAELCNAQAPCTANMQSVVDHYTQGSVDFLQPAQSGFSGACYHQDTSYDPNVTHYGAFTFDHQAQQIMATGLFFFFYAQDPYLNMTLQQVQQHLQNSGSKPQAGSLFKDHFELSYGDTGGAIRYWFRSDKQDHSLYVIGQEQSAGLVSRVFCKMTSH